MIFTALAACWFSNAPGGTGWDFLPGIEVGMGVVGLLMVLGMASEDDRRKRISADRQFDNEDKPKAFILTLGQETVVLEPGRPWTKVDIHKWVTRGLMEPPQSFHVQPNGNVDINGEKISLDDHQGTAKLEHEFNKRHELTAAPKLPTAGPAKQFGQGPTQLPKSGKAQFRVRLDHLGHLMIEGTRGAERMETSMRGINLLVANGFMLKPQTVHLDPLQRSVDIDGIKYECNEAGAKLLQETLNARYAPMVTAGGEQAIDIKENAASATGFDINFATVVAGTRIEVKGHLSQEKLDILQDPAKCDLLNSGIVLRLTPPILLVRRKRPDGGEEKIPEIPDVHYRKANAVQLQQIFNHPLVRRNSGQSGAKAIAVTQEVPAELAELRVVRNPQNKLQLWLEGITTKGAKPEGKAFTHHNVADLQHSGAFLPHLEVTLSFDNRALNLYDNQTHQRETITLDNQSSDDDLAKASQLLSRALKPPTHPAIAAAPTEQGATAPETAKERRGDASQPMVEVTTEPQLRCPISSTPAPLPDARLNENGRIQDHGQDLPEKAVAPSESPRVETPSPIENLKGEKNQASGEISLPEPAPPIVPPPPILDQSILDCFQRTDTQCVNTEVFRRLSIRLGWPAQDIRLDLARVFEQRRFEIISSSNSEIESVMDLRSADFTGFYLTHIKEDVVLLVYGCKGKHIEWGPQRCLMQPAVSAEANEFKGHALLGMAMDQNNDFVFIVEPAYKDWAKPFENQYLDVRAHFITVNELAATPGPYSLVWPSANA